MDEGWATTFELLIGRDKNVEAADKMFKGFRIEPWTNDPAAEHNMPIIIPGNVINGNGLRTNQYGKASLGYLAAKDLLGDVLFKKCLHEYMNRWNGKHPIPWDFFNTFNNVAGRNLNWLWNNWFFTFNYIDVAVQNVTKTGTGYTVSINNAGGFAIPLDIQVTYADGSKATLHQTPAIWQADQKQAKVAIKTSKAITAIRLDGNIFMDSNEADNQWEAAKK